jgi:hypothetical protein
MQVPVSQPQMAGLEEEPSDSVTKECCMSSLCGELSPGLQLGCGDPRFAPLEPLSEQSEQSERMVDDFLRYDAGLGSFASADEEAGRCQLVAPASPPELTERLFSFMDNVWFFTHRVWPSFHACALLWNFGPATDPVHVLQAPPPEPDEAEGAPNRPHPGLVHHRRNSSAAKPRVPIAPAPDGGEDESRSEGFESDPQGLFGVQGVHNAAASTGKLLRRSAQVAA